jgi:hypothetical protein
MSYDPLNNLVRYPAIFHCLHMVAKQVTPFGADGLASYTFCPVS